MIFETHAHYDDSQFDTDREELLSQMEPGGIGTIVNVSASYESCEKTVALALKYPYIYAAVGIHPDEVGSLTEQSFAQMKELYRNNKVVAVGEIGLDYYWDVQSHETQQKWFIRQLELAGELDLPVIIHSRDAASDTLDIIKKHGALLNGVIHCFSYSKEMAQEYVNMGYSIGIGGVITFPNGRKLKEVAEAIPLTSILLETDCPYLSPVPNRGKRNSSLNLTYVAQEIARLKGITYEEVIAQTEINARNLYKLQEPVSNQ